MSILQSGNWQDQFAQGFSAKAGATDNVGIVVAFLVIIGIGLVLWFLISRYQRTQGKPAKAQAHVASEEDMVPTRTKYVPVAGRINPLQQKIIQEMINEFRQHEDTAQAVPSSILEKYSEFFFHQIQRLKTSDREVEDFINKNYPLEEGYTIELDFPSTGNLHLIRAKVLEITGKSVLVEFHPPIPDFLKKGTNLHLNYTVGKKFLQGSTVITDVRPDFGLVLRRPHEVILTGERRYPRINLQAAMGTLQDPKTTFNESVKVLDVSLEGVRIQVGRPLKKRTIYQLTFVERGTKNWGFGPIECVASQAFLTATGTNEAGLLFLYLDLATRTRLVTYMKYRVQEAQGIQETPEPPAQE